MNCPHCNKVVIVKLVKDSNVGQSAPSSGTADISDLGELLGMIEDGKLEGAAVDFVKQTRERFEKYKDKTRMSDKQMSWLRKLAGVEVEEAWD